MAQFKLVKHNFPKLDYIALSLVWLSKYISTSVKVTVNCRIVPHAIEILQNLLLNLVYIYIYIYMCVCVCVCVCVCREHSVSKMKELIIGSTVYSYNFYQEINANGYFNVPENSYILYIYIYIYICVCVCVCVSSYTNLRWISNLIFMKINIHILATHTHTHTHTHIYIYI